MKKNVTVPTLQFMGNNHDVLLECKLTSVPLKDDAVLRLCVEFYNDPEPCMIHRSSVMSCIYMELIEYFQPKPGYAISAYHTGEISKRIASFFDVENYDYVIVKN